MSLLRFQYATYSIMGTDKGDSRREIFCANKLEKTASLRNAKSSQHNRGRRDYHSSDSCCGCRSVCCFRNRQIYSDINCHIHFNKYGHIRLNIHSDLKLCISLNNISHKHYIGDQYGIRSNSPRDPSVNDDI